MPKMLKGTGDFPPPEDLEAPDCDECDWHGEVLHTACGGHGGCDDCRMGYATCPGCNGTGYRNTEPDPDVGLDWMP